MALNYGFEVYFSITSDEEIVIDKTYGEEIKVDITAATGDIDILNIDLILKYNSNLLACNYARVPMFNRYYFVKWELMPDERMMAHLAVDVLKSHEAGIKGLTAIIVRATSEGRPTDTEDELLPLAPWQSVDIVAAPNSIHSNGNNVAYTIMIHTI